MDKRADEDVCGDLTPVREDDPSDETVQDIQAGLNAFNAAHPGASGGAAPLAYTIREAKGDLVAGLYGKTFWSWLFIEMLWVSDRHRGATLGSRLLQAAEDGARDRGCVGIFLNTATFQAPSFYQRHGFVEFGRLEGAPPGHALVWFAKRL